VSSSTDTARVALEIADGTSMNAYVARPKVGTPTAGMLVFQEAFGINAYMRDISDRFAALGFLSIAPELFHRTGPGFEGSYTDFESVRKHTSALTPDGVNADIEASYTWLREKGIDAPRVGAVGFCMGGRVAYMANARVQLGAAISFYGGGIVPDLLPLAQAQRAPILMFWGGLDTHIPPEQYRAVADALTAAKVTHEQVVFSQADHGFFCDARPSYNELASRQAWALVNAFLDVYGLL
jgi:carboxymethylenebutenolidase